MLFKCLFCQDLLDENLFDGLALNYELKISSKTDPKRCVSDFPFEEYFVANTYRLLVEYDAMFFGCASYIT